MQPLAPGDLRFVCRLPDDLAADAAPLPETIPSDLPRNVRPTHYSIEVTPDARALTFAGKVGIDVTVGQRVRQGQPLGAIGMTGRATGPHLHWAMVWLGERIDPVELTGPMR